MDGTLSRLSKRTWRYVMWRERWQSLWICNVKTICGYLVSCITYQNSVAVFEKVETFIGFSWPIWRRWRDLSEANCMAMFWTSDSGRFIYRAWHCELDGNMKCIRKEQLQIRTFMVRVRFCCWEFRWKARVEFRWKARVGWPRVPWFCNTTLWTNDLHFSYTLGFWSCRIQVGTLKSAGSWLPWSPRIPGLPFVFGFANFTDDYVQKKLQTIVPVDGNQNLPVGLGGTTLEQHLRGTVQVGVNE